MHVTLRDSLSGCERVRSSVLCVLERVDPARWGERPTPTVWSVGEQWDHLVKSEVGTSKMVRRLIRGDFADLARPKGAPFFDSGLQAYPYGRLPAPAGLVPDILTFAAARDQLAAVHARFLSELERFPGPDADALAAPDPATGYWFTLAGWVRLQALHEAHHLEQIESLLRR